MLSNACHSHLSLFKIWHATLEQKGTEVKLTSLVHRHQHTAPDKALSLSLTHPVELSDVLLLLLVHDDVDPGDGLAHDADLGQLGGGAAGHLGHPKAGQLRLEVIQLLRQLLLLLGAQLAALDFDLKFDANC